MSRAKITIVGTLRFSPDKGLLYPTLIGKPPRTQTLWLEVLSGVPSDPAYRRAYSEFMERQRSKPQQIGGQPGVWIYRGKVVRVESTEPDSDSIILWIKHRVLRQQRQYQRVRREVEALENTERLEGVSREPIPENVRLFVWQRDRGQCVKCSSRQRLEFDHIIPIAAGGSSTERNIQLLCEPCNRSKGSTI
jgi:5-methylcytosine-specific restriction endonuclease McrA